MWQVWKNGELIKDGFEDELRAYDWAYRWLKRDYTVKFVLFKR